MSMEIVSDVAAGGALAPEAALGPELASGADFKVEVIAHPAALALIAPEWRALEALSPAAAIFQSFAHIEHWAQHFIEASRGTALHVAIVRQEGRPC